MRQMATKRVWLLLLAVALLCALLVFPAAAETEQKATFRLTFQSESGGELGVDLTSGTVITARLLTEHPIDLTTAQLTVQVDSSKLEFVNEGTNKKDKYASSEMRDDDGLLFNFEHNVISTESEQKLKVVATSSDTQTWDTGMALVYFKLKVKAENGIQTSELPDLVQFSGKNNRDTTDGKDCTYVAKDDAETPVTYISDYNVCPYAQAKITEGEKLWSTATIAQLKERIEVTQYSAGGTASTGTNPTCTLYTAGSSTPLADTAMLRTVSASQLTGTLTGGIKFTLGDLSDWIQEDEIAAIRISTAETVKTEYTYGDVFDPTGVTVIGDYLSGKSEPIDLSKVTYNKQPLKRSDTEITFEYQGKRIPLPITVNPKRLDSAKFATYTLDDHVYTGSAIEPKPDLIYQDGGDTTIAPAEYDLSYSNNTNAGTATVTFTCKENGNYSFDPVQRNFTIRKKTITLLNVGVQSRAYDGTKTATVESFRGSVRGFVPGDNITIDTSSATATLDSADAGTRTATITGITIGGRHGGNYEIAQPPTATVVITPYIIQNPQFKQGNTTKTYDGTTNVASNFYMALSGASMLPGEQSADLPLVVQSAAYTSSDAADSATIQVQLKQLVGNYRLADDQLNATVAGKITPLDVGSQTITRDAITVTLGDGTFTEYPNTVAIGTQSVTLGAWTYQMDANEAQYTYTDLVNHLKTLPVGEHTITATAAATGNYTGSVQYSTTLYVKDIEFKVGSAEATFANTFTKITDTYTGDGFASYFRSNAVTATLAEQSVAGTFTVYVDDEAADAAQSSLSAGSHTVELKFSSTDGNYRNEEVCSGTFTIQPKELTVTGGITVDSRVYDGTPDFAVSQVHTTGAQLRGVCSGDAVTVQAVSIAQVGTGDANFGDKPVVITLKAMSGAVENSNYTVKDYSATAEITHKPVTITGTTVKNRAYDGTTVVEIENAGTLVGLIAADEGKVSVDTGKAHATASDKNVGTRTVTFTSFSINGSGTNNYTLKEQPAATTVQISQKSLTATVMVDDKDYDGTTDATARVLLGGVVTGDTVSAQAAVAFDRASASVGVPVTCTDITLSGKDAANYTVTLPTRPYATIRQAAPSGAPTFSSVTAANTPTDDVTADADGFCGVQGENLTGTVTVDWNGDTVVRANHAYSWTFVPDSANYRTCSGTAVLYRVNSGYSQQVKDQAEKFEAEKNGEVTEPDVPTFRDVRTGDYYYDAVQWAVENGITTGQSAKRFAPGAACSRAQVMTMLWRAMGQPESTQTVTLTDVRQSDYYREAVSWALENDITTGTGAGMFSPNATVTRAQVVTFLYRLSGAQVTAKEIFRDVAPDAYYAAAVTWAQELGITTGTGTGTFSPDAPCTRAQIITFLYRYFKQQ